MSTAHKVQACRLCLAMDKKLLEIEMGLKNSVKSMLGENVTKEELNKINRNKLGLESSLSTRPVALESIEPTEVVKEEVIDTDSDVSLNNHDDGTVEEDIDIKIEEPVIEEPHYDRQHEDMPLETEANNIQAHSTWDQVGDQGHEFPEYKAPLGLDPYLKEKSLKNHNVTEYTRISVNDHKNRISIEKQNCTLPNIKLPPCTTITEVVSSSQLIVCKKCLRLFKSAIFSEHERHCDQDVNQETVSALKNLGVTVLPEQNLNLIKAGAMTQYNSMSPVQFDLQCKSTENTAGFVNNIDKRLQISNAPCQNKSLGKQYVNKKKKTNSTEGTEMKGKNYNNYLQHDKSCVNDNLAVNNVSNLNIVDHNLRQANINANINTTIDVNKYMKAIDLLPQVTDRNNQMQSVNDSSKNKTKDKIVNQKLDMNSIIATKNGNEYISDIKQEKSEDITDFTMSKSGLTYSIEIIEDDLIQLNKNIDDISKVHNTNLVVHANSLNNDVKAEKHDINTGIKFNKMIGRGRKKGSKVEYETIITNSVITSENNNDKNSYDGRKSKKIKRKRMYSTDSDYNEPNKTYKKRRKKKAHRRWTQEEMEVVSRRFHSELDLHQNPGIAKCKMVLEQEPLLRGRTCRQLNSCINNLNVKQSKKQRRLAAKFQNSDRIMPFHSHLSLPSQVLAMRLPSGDTLI